METSVKMAQSIVGTSKGRSETDFYPTPENATLALLNMNLIPKGTFVWECACGNGAMSKVLDQWGLAVVSSDLYDYGYGWKDTDFLLVEPELAEWKFPKIIITNPPFNLIEKFIYHAINVLKVDKVCFLAKLALLEGQKRSQLLQSTPLKHVLVFRKRITLTRNGEPQRNSGMIAFAWYIWEKGYEGKPMIGWI